MSKKIQIRLKDEVVWDDFKQMVKDKYGVYHSNMALELQNAIMKHLCDEGVPGYEDIRSNSEKTYNHQDNFDPHTKIPKKDQLLIDYLYTNNADFDEFQITFKSLQRIMKSKCDLTSKATHERHVDYLLAKHILNEIEDTPEYTKYLILLSNLKSFVSPEIILQEGI